MLTDYLNQQAVYRPRVGADDRGRPVYGAPEVVACRKVRKVRRIRASDGEEIRSGTVVYLNREVNDGDEIDGAAVLAVDDWVDICGETPGWRAML